MLGHLRHAFRFATRAPRFWLLGAATLLAGGVVSVEAKDAEGALFASNAALRAWAETNPGIAAAAGIGAAVVIVGGFLLAEWAYAVAILAAAGGTDDVAPGLASSVRTARGLWPRVIGIDAALVLPVLAPVTTLVALATAGAGSAFATPALRALELAAYGGGTALGLAVFFVVFAWRDLAVRHALIDGASVFHAVREAAVDVTTRPLRIAFFAGLMWTVNALAVIGISMFTVPILATSTVALTPRLVVEPAMIVSSILLGPYAIFDVAAWTHFYREVRSSAGRREASDHE